MSDIPRRPYGNTGVELSIVSFGAIVVGGNTNPEDASRVVAESVERGINYFDVAPSYGDAQAILGPALEPHRKGVFLSCKTGKRDAERAEAELNESLAMLRTDHFDLYQLHHITDVEKDVDAVFAKGGAMEVFIEARKQGKVRFLGFSAHSVEAALAAMDRFDFDSVLFPVNFATYTKGNFGAQIMARAQEKGLARLALKSLALQQWPEDDPERQKYSKCWYKPITDKRLAELAFRFTLSQPVTAAVSPSEEVFLRWMMEFAERFRPITEEETAELTALAKELDVIFESTVPA